MDANRVIVARCTFSDLGGGGANVSGKDNRMEDSVIRRIGLLFLGLERHHLAGVRRGDRPQRDRGYAL